MEFILRFKTNGNLYGPYPNFGLRKNPDWIESGLIGSHWLVKFCTRFTYRGTVKPNYERRGGVSSLSQHFSGHAGDSDARCIKYRGTADNSDVEFFVYGKNQFGRSQRKSTTPEIP